LAGLRHNPHGRAFESRTPKGGSDDCDASRTARVVAIGFIAAAGVFPGSRANAAGTAYGVDTAEVGEVGNCKVESWLSWASNQDFIGVTNPSCVVNLGRAVEVSAQIQRARSDGEWGTSVAPKFKTNIVPSAIGRFGVAVAAGGTYDVLTSEFSGAYAYVPATLRLSEVMRINLNAGWQWDRIADRHFLLYGAGFDLRTPDNVWTLTAEVFGLLGTADTRRRRSRGFKSVCAGGRSTGSQWISSTGATSPAKRELDHASHQHPLPGAGEIERRRTAI